MVRSSSNSSFSTRFFILIGILAFSIIIGTIIGSSYISKEKFTNEKTLIYLYMDTCGFCKEFNSTWNKITESATDFKTVKYNMNSDEGKKLANDNNITYAPALLLQVNGKTIIYKENTRNINEILSWVNNNN